MLADSRSPGHGDRACPATRACRGTLTGRQREGGGSVLLSPRRSGSSVLPGIRTRSSDGCGWERSGNHVRSQQRATALSCSPVRWFTCGDREVTWWRGYGCMAGGQGVAGSNPAVPTGNLAFSNMFVPHMSQQKSQSSGETEPITGVRRFVCRPRPGNGG